MNRAAWEGRIAQAIANSLWAMEAGEAPKADVPVNAGDMQLAVDVYESIGRYLPGEPERIEDRPRRERTARLSVETSRPESWVVVNLADAATFVGSEDKGLEKIGWLRALLPVAEPSVTPTDRIFHRHGWEMIVGRDE